MRMVLWKNQQILLTFLLVSLTYPWKLMMDIHHESMKIFNTKTGVYKTWLEHPYLTEIKNKINGSVELEHPLKFIDE